MTTAADRMLARVAARRLVALAAADGGGFLPPAVKVAPPESRLSKGLEWFRKRLNLTPERFAALEERARKHAFTVAGVAQLDLIAQVKEALATAISDGATFDDFVDQVGDQLKAEWKGTVKNPGARLETVFRTNIQSAYNAGKYHAAIDPEAMARRPYLLVIAVKDVRTSEICKPYIKGVVRPANDPWIRRHVPPFHHNCRTTIRQLTEAQALQRGITSDGELPAVEPAPGFGHAPGAPIDLFAGKDPSLAAIVRQKLRSEQYGQI